MEFRESSYIEDKENSNLTYMELQVMNVKQLVLCKKGIYYIG